MSLREALPAGLLSASRRPRDDARAGATARQGDGTGSEFHDTERGGPLRRTVRGGSRGRTAIWDPVVPESEV
jgi:hypothetical protein